MPDEIETDDFTMDLVVSCDPEVMSGTLVFAGTRVPVDALFDNLFDDMSVDEFLENFPSVERWQVVAAIRIGARSLTIGRASSTNGNDEN